VGAVMPTVTPISWPLMTCYFRLLAHCRGVAFGFVREKS
jgi:hypothetical protein